MIFQHFIQQLHRHFLRKCAALFDVLISAGTKAFYMHMVSAQIQGFTFVISLVFFLFFGNHTALNTAADEAYQQPVQ